MSNRVVVESTFRCSSRSKEKVRRAVLGTLRSLRYKNAFVSAYFVTDQEIKLLNSRFRGKHKATTVLSFGVMKHFPQPDLPQSLRFLGDIYLAPKYIARVDENLERLAVHGTLHLSGYTHGAHRDRIKMELCERRIAMRLRL